MRSIALALAACFSLTLPAHADLDAGIAALDAGDTAEALRQFQDPSLAQDAQALAYLAWMAYAGLGQVKDNALAYALLSLSVMHDPAGPESQAVANRRQVASEMTAEEIVAAEQLVVARLRDEMGEEGLLLAAGKALIGLQNCHQKCDSQALAAAALGPSAMTSMLRLEALMTEDIYWMPRQTYGFALYAIGTRAVPGLCRIAEDRAQRRAEGTWNVMQAAYALGGMGAAARPEGHACLLRVMAELRPGQPALQEDLGRDLAGDADAFLNETERVLTFALVAIGDPKGQGKAAAMAIFAAEPDALKGRLMAYVIGMTYGDLEPILQAAPGGLASDEQMTVQETLYMLQDLSDQPGFAQGIAPLMPALRALAQGDNPDTAELAAHLLGQIAP